MQRRMTQMSFGLRESASSENLYIDFSSTDDSPKSTDDSPKSTDDSPKSTDDSPNVAPPLPALPTPAARNSHIMRASDKGSPVSQARSKKLDKMVTFLRNKETVEIVQECVNMWFQERDTVLNQRDRYFGWLRVDDEKLVSRINAAGYLTVRAQFISLMADIVPWANIVGGYETTNTACRDAYGVRVRS